MTPGPAWQPFTADPRRACLLTDFDGTLSPIVDDPAGAGPLPGAVDLLRRLAGRFGRVAVVSGRPAAFLAGVLGTGLEAAALYGLEALDPTGQVRVAPEAEAWREVVDAAAAEAEAEAPAGVLVERKGLSLALHYRTAPRHEGAVARVAAGLAGRHGLVPHPARMSVELLPPLRADKGQAVERMAAGFAAVAFVGDDVGDLPAFRALDRLASRDGVAVRKVAVASAEMPEALAEAADEVVAGPPAVLDLLRSLLG